MRVFPGFCDSFSLQLPKLLPLSPLFSALSTRVGVSLRLRLLPSLPQCLKGSRAVSSVERQTQSPEPEAPRGAMPMSLI